MVIKRLLILTNTATAVAYLNTIFRYCRHSQFLIVNRQIA